MFRVDAASVRPGQYVLVHNGRLDLCGYVHMTYSLGDAWTILFEVTRSREGIVTDTQSVLLRPGHVIHVVKDEPDVLKPHPLPTLVGYEVTVRREAAPGVHIFHPDDVRLVKRGE